MIDAHHHLWDLTAREHRWLSGDQPWASDAELASLRRSFTIGDLAPLAATRTLRPRGPGARVAVGARTAAGTSPPGQAACWPAWWDGRT